jgi:hypothetical protein
LGLPHERFLRHFLSLLPSRFAPLHCFAFFSNHAVSELHRRPSQHLGLFGKLFLHRATMLLAADSEVPCHFGHFRSSFLPVLSQRPFLKALCKSFAHHANH